jgi:hypothetical protein
VSVRGPIALTATVTSGSGTPTGTVDFFNGTTQLAEVALSSGKAIYNYNPSTLSLGTYPLTATYIPTGNFSASTPAPVTRAGFGGALWGLGGESEEIHSFVPQTQGWNHVPGSLNQIVVGPANAVWGINAQQQVFYYNSQTKGFWEQIPGQLAQISVAFDGTVWGVNAAQQVFTFDPLTQGWDQITGSLTQIAVGSDGVVWGINAQQQIFRLQ